MEANNHRIYVEARDQSTVLVGTTIPKGTSYHMGNTYIFTPDTPDTPGEKVAEVAAAAAPEEPSEEPPEGVTTADRIPAAAAAAPGAHAPGARVSGTPTSTPPVVVYRRSGGVAEYTVSGSEPVLIGNTVAPGARITTGDTVIYHYS